MERELNVVKCPVCNAVPGDPCFVVVDEEKARRKAQRDADPQARIKERAAKVVADGPPLSGR